MSRTLLVRLSAGLALSLGAWVAYTQTPQAPPKLDVHKIKDDLYVIETTGAIAGNVTVYLTDDGVILVDDKFEQDHDNIVAKVKALTNKPIKYVLNTHHHQDHSGGNAKMQPAVEIISHINARANMVEGKQSGLPQVVFRQESGVFLGGKEVRALYFGRSHTNGDAVIYFPALRVLAAGDMFTQGDMFPQLIDYSGGGSASDWPKTIDGVLTLDFDTVVPGHGPVAKRQDLINFRAKAQRLRDRVRDLNRQKKTRDEISKALVSEFYWQQLHIDRSLDGIIAETR